MVLICTLGLYGRGYAQAADASPPPPSLQIDLFGSAQFSRFNFTPLKTPYNGVDASTTLRVAQWFDGSRRVGAFADLSSVFASPTAFFFQRYVQASGGLQVYPLSGRFLRPLRVFTQISRRRHYDLAATSQLQKVDLQVGADYYFDNLFTTRRWKTFAYTVVGLHTTAFNREHFNAVRWSGNVKTGPSFLPQAQSVVVPYAVAEWTYAASHRDLFWENFLRAGGGVRWHPQRRAVGRFASDLRGRLHVFTDVVANIAWLGDAPYRDVEKYDVRIGIGFSTGGIYRNRFR